MRICIDPGRGGKDNGRAAGKILEKNITLRFSELLAEAFQSLEVASALTRSGDETTSIADRAALHSAAKTDCLISIHCNASSNEKDCGVTVGRFRPENEGLANAVAAALNGESTFDDIEILRFAKSPCVIVRIGYMTNHQDLKKILMDEKHLKQMAEKLAEAVVKHVSN